MAHTQSSPSSPTQSRSKKNSVVTEPPKIDLESYIQNYQGRTRWERLFRIGTTSSFLGIEALKAAVAEAKNGRDTMRYITAVNNLQANAPSEPEAQRDTAWVETTDKQNEAESQRLEAELKGYKNNLIKESIRMGNEDLGKHYQAIGDLGKAFEAYGRMRQDITVSRQIIDVSKHVIEVAIEQKNWIVVSSNVAKIRSVLTGTEEEDKQLQSYACAAEGLALMASGEYYGAARAFLGTEAGMGSSCNTIISPNDIAIYGSLCALASMDRNELNTRILENSTFRTYLELEPHIRRAIAFFVNSRYFQCLGILEAYRPDYLLDIHLHEHLEGLYYAVRSKSIVQYFIPFSCVTLESLNETFASQGKSIEKELSKMIERKELDARIDTVNKTLISLPSAPRSALHNSALRTAKEYEREARRRIQHMNIIGADLDIKGQKKGIKDMDDLYAMGGAREMRSRH